MNWEVPVLSKFNIPDTRKTNIIITIIIIINIIIISYCLTLTCT